MTKTQDDEKFRVYEFSEDEFTYNLINGFSQNVVKDFKKCKYVIQRHVNTNDKWYKLNKKYNILYYVVIFKEQKIKC